MRGSREKPLWKEQNWKVSWWGEKLPHRFRHFCGRLRILKPRKIGTKYEQAARLSLQRGWPPAVLQSSSHQRHLQLKAGACQGPHGMPHGKGPRGREMLSSCGYPASQHSKRILQPATVTSFGSQSSSLFSSTHRSNLIQGFVKEASTDLFWACANSLQIRMLGLSLSLSQISSGKRGVLSQ